MLRFDDIDLLLKEIERDKLNRDGSSSRYCTRVIFFDSFHNFKLLIEKLGVSQIDLSNKLSSPQKWFTFSYLIKLIQDQNKSTIIYPLSEIIRFYSNEQLRSFLTTLFETQNSEESLDRRIYVPLVGLYEKFSSEFWNRYHRQNEGPPVWRYVSHTSREKIKIYKLDTNIKTDLSLITNNIEWLNFWKIEKQNPVISTSSSLNRRWHFFQSDDCYDARVLDNISDFLKCIYSLNIKMPYKNSENEYWEQLLNIYEKYCKEERKSYVQFINQYFNKDNIYSLSDSELISLYLSSQKFEKWLIKAYYLTEKQSGYLFKVISNCSDYSNTEIILLLYLNIFDFEDINENILEERNELIVEVSKNHIDEINQVIPKFLDRIDGIENIQKIKLIPGCSFLERKYIFNLLSENDDSFISTLSKKLPDIASYLDWETIIHNFDCQEWVYEYFMKYNETKLFNHSMEIFEEKFVNVNKNSDTFFKWYYKFDKIPLFTDGVIVQIDAIGLEWLPFIVNIINNEGAFYNKEITSIQICRAELPTITQYNKLEEAQYIQDFDILIHDVRGYKYPDTLLQQLSLLKELICNHVLKSPESKIYLTSDHGSTCHCMKQFGQKKKYDFEDEKHEGRYLKNVSNLLDNESFIRYNDYYIGLRYDSLNDLPRREVHGGASPEEVLIPFITIEKSKHNLDLNYEITVLNNRLSYENKVISVKIDPKPDEMPVLIVNDKKFEGTQDNNKYIFILDQLLPGKYSAIFLFLKQEYKFDFEITGGIQEEDLF